MEFRTLDITLKSGKKLKKVNLFRKMDIYAVVSISGGGESSKQEKTTPPDYEGDSDPTWNYRMEFKVHEAALQKNNLNLDFKLVCRQALGKDKDVGNLSVPIKELLDSPGTSAGKQFTYYVLKPDGEPKGMLTFSCKFSEKNQSGLGSEVMQTIESVVEAGKHAVAVGLKMKQMLMGSGSGSEPEKENGHQNKPVQNKPVQCKPIQSKPAQCKPVQTKPAQRKPSSLNRSSTNGSSANRSSPIHPKPRLRPVPLI